MLKKANSMNEPDIYTLETFTDKGLPVYSGECFIGLEEFHGETCSKFSGKFTYYDVDGAIELENNYVRGHLDGESKKITKENIIIFKYVKDKLIQKTILDKATNKKIKVEEYFEDGSRK